MKDYMELIEALKCCFTDQKGCYKNCFACPYEPFGDDCEDISLNALNAIEQLFKERDFMYDYIPRQCNTCGNYVCTVDSFGINSYGCDKGGCADWKRKENWKWRGVQK